MHQALQHVLMIPGGRRKLASKSAWPLSPPSSPLLSAALLELLLLASDSSSSEASEAAVSLLCALCSWPSLQAQYNLEYTHNSATKDLTSNHIQKNPHIGILEIRHVLQSICCQPNMHAGLQNCDATSDPTPYYTNCPLDVVHASCEYSNALLDWSSN